MSINFVPQTSCAIIDTNWSLSGGFIPARHLLAGESLLKDQRNIFSYLAEMDEREKPILQKEEKLLDQVNSGFKKYVGLTIAGLGVGGVGTVTLSPRSKMSTAFGVSTLIMGAIAAGTALFWIGKKQNLDDEISTNRFMRLKDKVRSLEEKIEELNSLEPSETQRLALTHIRQVKDFFSQKHDEHTLERAARALR